MKKRVLLILLITLVLIGGITYAGTFNDVLSKLFSPSINNQKQSSQNTQQTTQNSLQSLAVQSSPPVNSPIALGQHPRLFFSQSDLPVLRDRISTYYATEFQDFINMLNNPSIPGSADPNWGSLDYAFIAALDPAQMQQRGFTFSAALDTPQEYCDKAMTYARSQFSAISSGVGQGHGDLAQGYPTNNYIPILAAYDWCYPYLSSADKTAIVDAFVNAYNTNYKGNNLLGGSIHGYDMFANNQASADIFDILGIVAFYNDPYPSTAIQTEMYDAFQTFWLNRVMAELNYFYKDGHSWHEGSGGYLWEGFMNLGTPIAMFSSALGTDYFSTMPYFYKYPEFFESNIKPQGLLLTCGSGTSKCPEYLERWGTISGGIDGIGCKVNLLISGFLRKSNHPSAPLAKWTYTETQGDCDTTVTQYGSTWSNAVLFWFIYGDKEVTAQSPTQLNINKTQKLGLGEYVMKSDYTSQGSQVIFWAMPYRMYGHDSDDYGQFTLHKFGNLILAAANSKSGDAVLTSAKFNLFENNIGIHKGSADNTLGFNGASVDPFFGARGITTINTAGSLLSENINNGLFDYIAYNSTPSWSSSTADLSQREFVYLRGPTNKEYILLLDRINVINPSTDEKIWKAWVPTQPVFENGNPTNPRTGKWTSSNTNTISLTNAYSGLTTPRFQSAPTHGKFYLKVLSPTNPTINLLGGPGQEFQSGDDDGSTPWGAPSMTQGMHEYLGWGRIEIRPQTPQNYDTFLNVIQFGDSNTLNAITDIVRIDSQDAKLMGSHIRDPQNQWAVLFVKNNQDLFKISSFSYTLTGTGSINHLITGLKKNTNYNIVDNSVLLFSKKSNDAGTLQFTTNLGSTHTLSLSEGPALELYVDNNAPAGGIGTIASPFNTIQAALNIATAGYTIYVRGDTSGSGRVYTENINFINSGTQSSPIILQAYTGEKIIISHSSSISLNQDYIIIDGLTFDHQNQTSKAIIWSGNKDIIRNSEVRNGKRDGIAFSAGVSDNIIENSNIHDFIRIEGGLRIDAHCIVTDPSFTNVVIRNNIIHDCSGDAYQAFATDATSQASTTNGLLIEGNIIYSTLGPNMENGLDLKEGSNITIKNNTFYGFITNKAVVAQKYHNNIKFVNNIIHDSDRGIELRGEPVGILQTNITVANNLIYNINITSAGFAIKLDGVVNTDVYHNTIVNSVYKSIFFDVAGINNGNIKNNLVYNSGPVSGSGTFSGVSFSNNGWFTSGASFLSGANDVTGTDPKFVNTAANNYNLQSTSTAIDKGAILGLPYTYFGTAPDLGAYEFGGSVTPPDTIPPARSNLVPQGTQYPSTTTQVTISLSTDEVATCKFSTQQNILYNSMINSFNTTNGISHSSAIIVGLSQGLNTYYVKCQDSLGNANPDDAQIYFTIQAPDTTPPTISNIQSSASSSSATITWTTNEVSDSQVEYGLSASYGQQTTVDTTQVTSHSIIINGLSANTSYHFRVKSKDISNNIATSTDNTFTTANTPSFQGIHIDFDNTLSPRTQPGYVGFVPAIYSVGVGYGYNSTLSIDTRDRSQTNLLYTDRHAATINSLSTGFLVDIPLGDYNITIYSGDYPSATADLLPMNVYAEGQLKITLPQVPVGVMRIGSFTSSVTDGQLNLVFYSSGGVWKVNGLDIVALSGPSPQDTTPPTIANPISSPVSPTIYSPTQPHTFTSTITDNQAIQTVYIEHNFNGAVQNTTLSSATSTYSFSRGALGAGTYTYKFIAIDSSGNQAVSTPQTYQVSQAVPTTTLSLSPVSPITYITPTTVSCTDTNPESTPTLQKDTTTITPGTYTYGSGTYSFTCTTPQTQNYSASSATPISYTVSQAQPQLTLTLNSQASDIQIAQGQNAVIQSSLITPTQGALTIYQSGISIATGPTPQSTTQTYNIVGNYNITSYYPGNQNYTGGSQTRFVVVGNPPDTVPPTVTINSPQNNIITNNTQVSIDCSASDLVQLKNLSLVLDGALVQTVNTNAQSFSNTFTQTLSESSHTFNCEAYDNSSNKATATQRIITIDTIPPVLSITSPQATTYNTNQVSLSYSASGYSQLYYTLNGGSAINLTQPVILTLSNSPYTLVLTARDLAGNQNTQQVIFRVDTSIAACTVNCEMNISLVQGANLISLPLVVSNYSIESIIQNIKPSINAIYTYDPISLWKVYHTDNLIPSTLTQIESRKAFFVMTTQPTTLTIRGNLLDSNNNIPPLSLSPGWNLIGIHNLTDMSANDVIQTPYLSVWDLQSGLQSYREINTTLDRLLPSKGYWVYIQ